MVDGTLQAAAAVLKVDHAELSDDLQAVRADFMEVVKVDQAVFTAALTPAAVV